MAVKKKDNAIIYAMYTHTYIYTCTYIHTHTQLLDDGSLAVQNKDDAIIWTRGKQGTRFSLRDKDSTGNDVCNVILEDRSSEPYKCIWDSLDSCPKPPEKKDEGKKDEGKKDENKVDEKGAECAKYKAPNVRGDVCIVT